MRGPLRVAVAAVLVAGVAACSDPPTDTVSPASRSRSVTGGATPAPAIATDTPTDVAEVPALPESELPRLDGYRYARVADVPGSIPGLAGDYVSGYVGRAVRRGSQDAGVVQVVRVRRVTSTTPAFVEGFLQQYAQTSSFRAEKLAGERVRTTSRLRGRPGGLVTWLAGRDLVLVYNAAGLAGAREVARAYLRAADEPA
jgi:hypothetical protein